MTIVVNGVQSESLTIDLSVAGVAREMTAEQFYEFCRDNRDLRIERAANGDIIVMSPAGGRSGRRNAELTFQLTAWSKRDGTGVAFDSSTAFVLPKGATRSPDGAWVVKPRWEALTDEQQEKFLPLCPDFVVELRSPTDKLPTLQEKMREYMDNGARLGWLIDPQTRRAHVYRPGSPAEVLENPQTLSADPVLPGFVLDLREMW